MQLTKEAILNAKDITTEAVEVPEWGGTVNVRTMSGLERDRWEGKLLEVNTTKVYDNMRATLVAITACSPDGERLFTDADIEALSAKNAEALSRIYSVALKVNGLTRAVREEIEKNSEPSPDASSPTD